MVRLLMFGGGLQMYMYCIIRAAEDECEVKIYSDKKITWLCIKSSILPTELKVFQFSDPTQKVWIKCLQIKLRAYANISCHVFNVLNDMAETNVRFCLLIIYFILWSIYDYIFQVIGLYTGRGQYGIMLYQKLCTGCTTARK